MPDRSETTLTRRETLGLLGAAGAASLVAMGSRDRAWAAACTAAPAETEGPFFVDERLNRSDIRVDPSDGSVQPGVPLRLELKVLRVDAGCAPAAGVQVDVWHASAGGVYSDESGLGSGGRKFLRGYQVTDANGAVAFTTVYPGWYTGRTIHVHAKLRTFDGGTTSFEFTSQLYFDDAVSDHVLAQSAYAGRGARDTTNAADTIYDAAMLLALTDDGAGGWVGRFDVGVQGLPASAGGVCADLSSCRAALTAALPDPATATDRKHAKIARRLARLNERAGRTLDRAASASGGKQSRLYRRAGAALQKLVDVATTANDAGTLDASLATLSGAVTTLVALLPAT